MPQQHGWKALLLGVPALLLLRSGAGNSAPSCWEHSCHRGLLLAVPRAVRIDNNSSRQALWRLSARRALRCCCAAVLLLCCCACMLTDATSAGLTACCSAMAYQNITTLAQAWKSALQGEGGPSMEAGRLERLTLPSYHVHADQPQNLIHSSWVPFRGEEGGVLDMPCKSLPPLGGLT